MSLLPAAAASGCRLAPSRDSGRCGIGDGILTPGNIDRAGRALGRPVETVGDVAELAVRYGHLAVWVAPGVHLEVLAPGWRMTPADPGPLVPFVSLTRNGDERRDVGFLARDDALGFADVSPSLVLDALALYGRVVGRRYRWSPGHVSDRLMLTLGKREQLAREPHPYPAPALDGATEADMSWHRPLQHGERAQRYVHAYDANGRYLAALGGCDLGLGRPVWVQGSPAPGSGLPPGYWQVKPRPIDPDEPPWCDPLGLGGPWWTTQTVQYARQYGQGPEIVGGWVWERHARWLEPWYQRLRDARRELILGPYPPDVAALALGLVKRTYTIGIGYLAGHFRDERDELYRPDWRHTIVARARVNLARAVHKANLHPFAVDVDAIYITSNQPDPIAAAGTLPLAAGRLGYFKHAGTFRTVLATEALASPTPLVGLRRAARSSRAQVA